MKRKKLLMLLGSVCLALVLVLPLVASCAAPTPTPTPELPIVKWVWYSWCPAHMYHAKTIPMSIIENISDRTDGKFQITGYYGGGALGFNQDEIHSAISNEVMEISEISLGAVAGALPWCGIFGRPFLASWPDEFYQLNEAVFPIFEREFARMGITPVKAGFALEQPQFLWTIDPIEDITDLGGVKIRVWDEATTDAALAMGATTILLSYHEVYLALQLRTMEGTITGATGVYGNKLYEMIKHGYLVGVSVPAYYVTYNSDAFERLPSEYKTILLEEIEKACKLYRGGLLEDYEHEMAGLVAEGVQMHEISDEDSSVIAGRLRPNWQKWADAGGPVARELLDIALETLGY